MVPSGWMALPLHCCLTTVLLCLLCGLRRHSPPPRAALFARVLCSPLPSLGGKTELIYCDTWTHMDVPGAGLCYGVCRGRYTGL